MCNTGDSARLKGFMKTDVYETLLKKMHNLNSFANGNKTLALHTVGEPFLHPQLKQLLKVSHDNEVKIMLSTNGQLPKQIKTLLDDEPQALNAFRFSVDAATETTYEKVRRGGILSKVLESLEIIKAYNESHTQKILVAFESVLSLSNINEIPQFFEVFAPYLESNEHIKFNLLAYHKYGNDFYLEDFPWRGLEIPSVPCYMPINNQYFTYDGKVTSCCVDWDGNIIVGDAMKDELIDIWNNENSKELRNYHLNKGGKVNQECADCTRLYPFAGAITNRFIHSMIQITPDIAPVQLGQWVTRLLTAMEECCIEKNNNTLFKKVFSVYSAAIQEVLLNQKIED